MPAASSKSGAMPSWSRAAAPISDFMLCNLPTTRGRRRLAPPAPSGPDMAVGKRLLRAEATRRALSGFVYLYMRFVYATTRWTVVGEEHAAGLATQGLTCVAAFWHGRMLMLPMELRRLVRRHSREHPPSVHMLISGHGDGRAISDVIRYTDIRTVEGSSNSGGSRALRTLVQHLQKGECVGITPD